MEFIDIENLALLNEALKMKTKGFRLAQICASMSEGQLVLLYSFSKDGAMVNLRISLADGESVESIGCLYSYAFIYENEMKDLFGVNILDMNLDFGGNLYKTSVKTPFNTQVCNSPDSVKHFNTSEKEVKSDG